MGFRRIRTLLSCAAMLSLAVAVSLVAQNSTHRGRKYKSAAPTSRIEVTILRNDDAKPVENASVIFHLVGDKGNMELKTNEDGKTVIDVLPTGSKVLLQVIAKGYQTFGENYDVDKSQMAIEVKLKRPGQQYSVYDKHPESARGGKEPEAGKGAEAKPEEADAAPAETKPDASKPQPQQ